MKERVSIGFSDEYMLHGAREEAERQGIRLSEYIENLVQKDLKEKLQYKIRAFYSNGDTKEETDFYTNYDLMQSAAAYEKIWKDGEPMPFYAPEKVFLTGFEVWKHGEILIQKGQVAGK